MKGIALLLPVLAALQVGVQPALAWAWPVDGPVLRPFVLGDDPYAGGQHRGIDIGAPAGTSVRAPVSGLVSFAGVVPNGGRTITIRTSDGYSVTLQHLGSSSVGRGAEISEGDSIASVAQALEPYLYLGVRKADEPHGYVDPLGLLPAPVPVPADPEPVEPDPAPAPAHSGTKHHSPAPTPQPVSVEVPSARPAVDLPAEPRARHLRVAKPSELRHERRSPQARSRDAGAPVQSQPRRSPAAGVRRWEVAARSPVREGEPDTGADSVGTALAAALAALGTVGLGCAAAGLARRRLCELGDARAAHGPAPMLLQRAPPAAEDADGLRLGQEDDVVLHRDFERILLREREALADLDRNHDPTEVVDVANDPRLRCPPRRARRALRCSVRPQRSSAFLVRRIPRKRSPRSPISNHRCRPRGGAESFV